MFPKINNIRGKWNWIGVLVDIFMLFLTIGDLTWLMFDALYTNQTVQGFIDPIFPFYNAVHLNFYVYDGIIVTIFIAEFFGKWLFAILKKQYDKWFFYPFVNWYDVLGCFPTSTFRILRLFRIIGLTYRLHKWQVIDLNNYALYKTLTHYYTIAIEEISDRVVIRVLTEAKEEVQRGESLAKIISKEVLQPRRTELAKILTQVIQKGLQEKYPQYQKLLQKHLQSTVEKIVKNNEEVKQLERVPIVGTQLNRALSSATSEITFGVIDTLIKDASAPENQEMCCVILDSVLDVLLTQHYLQDDELADEILMESIDLIIQRVNVKQWKKRD